MAAGAFEDEVVPSSFCTEAMVGIEGIEVWDKMEE